ncbi:CesD/SycD/LcrH family type III secretion system chaperone [Aeromonas veronii]
MSAQNQLDQQKQTDDILLHCLDMLDGKCPPTTFSQVSTEELERLYARGYQALNNGKNEEATEIFAFLAMQQPLDRRFTFAFACTLKEQGEFRHALTLFTQTMAMQANEPFAIFHIAECLLGLEEREAARDALDAVITLCYAQADLDPNYDLLRSRAEDLLVSLNH